MNEELKKLRESIGRVEEKVDDLCKATLEVKESFKNMAGALNSFIEMYMAYQKQTDERLSRLEKHLGL